MWRPLFLALISGPAVAQEPLKLSALTDLSLEELSRIEITSVSRRAEPLNTAAASVFVITNDDIARSGANTLAEALRLAPNLDVARLDASQYAISARGFNTNIANKLLVLVDGRTIYSPLFSGVLWDSNDVMLEDVERIEVISGPAGSLWGTNAVNGVINVITRSASDTNGTLASVSAGNREQAAAARYGRKLGEADFRVYAKAFKTDAATEERTGASSTFERQQAGFRSDWSHSANRFTVQGELYQGKSSARRNAGGIDLSGGNLLGRWTRQHADGSSTQVRAYLDETTHRDPFLLDENATLFDVDLRHQRDVGRHRWVLGTGYRYAEDNSDPGTNFAFVPARRNLNWANLYAQDQIALGERWDLTLGTRFERNDYTGWEVLPNARLGWKATTNHFFWTAISRAVRAPSRIEREIVTPPRPPFLVTGSPDFQSEIAKVFELGARGQPTRTVSYSATLFQQRYDHLKSAEPTPGTFFPITTGNKIAGTIEGLEAWAAWQPIARWRLSAGGTHLHKSLHLEEGSNDPVGPANLGNDPDTHWVARSLWNLVPGHDFDVTVRHTSSRAPLPPNNTDPIPAYTGLDMRYAWAVTKTLELAVIGTNLNDPSHREWGDRTVSSEIARSIFLRATLRM